jgi:uncharacterized protein
MSFTFVAADGSTLAGTLVTPPGATAAALILNGSGPIDRDSNMPGQTLDIARALADALAARGIAVLRYDKRGIGESGGEYLATGFDDETRDAAAAFEVLAGIAPVTVIGHSVGATIAIRLATAGRAAGVVLLAAATQPGAVVMERQTKRIAMTMRGLQRPLRGWFVRRQAAIRRDLLESSAGRLELPARWFREYMPYDPVPDLRAIRCPVLAVTGANDVQVDPGDVARIGELVSGPFTGHTPEGLTHVLRRGPAGLGGYAAQLERPVDPELLDLVATRAAGESS